MPDKKEVKLRDQQPQSDPKGGKHHHSKKTSSTSGDPGSTDPTQNAPGQIGGFPPKYTP